MVWANTSSGTRSGIIPASADWPALFTMTSSRPKRSQAAPTIASTAAESAMSQGWATAVPPASLMADRTSSSLSLLRAASTTLAPAPARPWANVRPRP